jgi:AraC-like DNA-binding protein
MKPTTSQPNVFKSISRLMRALKLPAPSHPLVVLLNYDLSEFSAEHAGESFIIDFFKISFKRDFSGQVKYGQGHYDFAEGGLAFLAPNQLVTMSGDEKSFDGYTLYFHADLIAGYPLGRNIRQYGFFDYGVAEALCLSAREKEVINSIFASMAAELENNVDAFTQDVLVSQLELLLNHSNRFYNRQFITRKVLFSSTISRMEAYLSDRIDFDKSKALDLDRSMVAGIPTVQEVAEHLNVSPRYLTDMLKSMTGQGTQQYIQNRLIEKAKQLLAEGSFSIAEIAYRLGFEHPQSFTKLFKKTTSMAPRDFRHSLN